MPPTLGRHRTTSPPEATWPSTALPRPAVHKIGRPHPMRSAPSPVDRRCTAVPPQTAPPATMLRATLLARRSPRTLDRPHPMAFHLPDGSTPKGRTLAAGRR